MKYIAMWIYKCIHLNTFNSSCFILGTIFIWLASLQTVAERKNWFKKTIDLIENVISVLTDMREALEKEFELIFNDANVV